MSNILFCLSMKMVLMPLLFLAYKYLPRERWQIFASIPSGKQEEESGWRPGINITFYGLFLATGSGLAVVFFTFLLASIGLPVGVTVVITALVVTFSLVGAKLIARLVEKKKNTFTVAGGASVGLYMMPLSVAFYNSLDISAGKDLPLLPVMAALAIAYLVGEGIGRLACISFGCCYGKPLDELGPIARKIFSRLAVTFHGSTKKIVYASGLGGVKVVPIQAVTSYLYVNCGITGSYLFLEGYYAWSFFLCAGFAMLWRIFSEQFRADFRGNRAFTSYQWMALANIAYILILLVFSPETSVSPADLVEGISALWDPGVILFFQVLWGSFFLATGLSKVTGARLSFHVHRKSI